ncbi:MAG: hypothetical protein LBB41_04200 [Prevotellaceae bacterium]|jgi:hypothetical protein|nr:hypothetical protein [Prevotellaceae bacterium]
MVTVTFVASTSYGRDKKVPDTGQLLTIFDGCEQRYRQEFEEKFDLLAFDSALVAKHCSPRHTLAFDLSYIPKSGFHVLSRLRDDVRINYLIETVDSTT